MALDKRAWRCQKGHGIQEKGHGAAPCYFALDLTLIFYRKTFIDIYILALVQHFSTSLAVGDIREFIVQHRGNFINMQSEDPLLLEVRRQHVLADSLAIMRYSQEDLHNPLQIKFCGEDGVDLGGLRREFWSIFLHQLIHSVYVTGNECKLLIGDSLTT